MQIEMNKLWETGVRAEMPRYLQSRIRTSNVVALVLTVVAISYWIISANFNPELNAIPIIGLVAVLLAGLLNYIGFTTFSRFLLAIAPTTLAMLYQAYLVEAGGNSIAGLMMLSLSFSTLPFVLFDLREGIHVFVPVACCFALIAGFPFLRDWLELPLEDEIYRNGILYHITVLLSFTLGIVNILVLAYMNLLTDRQSEKLLNTAEEQNRAMADKEKEMQQHLVELQKAQEEERRRAWASEGFSKFGALLRKQDNEQQMYDMLLAGIVKYVDANQAGLYLIEGEGPDLKLVLRTAYAYGRKKHQDKQVEPGQGLLGQCYLEKDYIYMTQLPQKYTYITSGLGDATPSALLLVPLMAEEEVMGVLEIAAFRAFPQHIIEFLMKLGQDIAATVSISQTNSLTQQLLMQAQEQTEQMRAQEEEMRQNMEELSATQEELQRKEREYMRQIAQLEQKMQELQSVTKKDVN